MMQGTTTHESLFSSLVEFSPSGMVLVDGQGRILLVNRAVEECFGYSRDELLGKHVEELLPSRLRQGHQSLRQAFLRSPSTRPMGSGRDLYAARKDGSEFPVEVGLNPVPGTEGPEVLAVIVDISERKAMERETARLQEKLQQAQKMESLGVLAGGVAHDFNNLLTGVIGNSDLALLSLPETSPACANLHDIQRTALRAADLCRQMLAYSGRGRFEIKSIDLNGVIEEMLQLLHSNIDSSIQIANKLKSGLPAIEGDPSQVGQVVMNLVLNAAEAMPEGGGRIELRTGMIEADQTYLNSLQLHDRTTPGTFISMEVTDTGSGMDSLTLERIFDPFFTTKFTGRGLGLAAVAGIVRGHKGGIFVTSTPGKGSSFRVLFPCSDLPVTPQSDDVLSVASIARAKRLLIVDDEPVVREVLCNTLHQAGYKVVAAADGESGLALFRERAESWDLVLLDLTMPGMGGEEVFRLIREQKPALPILMMSGYDESEVTLRLDGQGSSGFLQKPLRPQQVLECIHSVLNPEGNGLA